MEDVHARKVIEYITDAVVVVAVDAAIMLLLLML